MILPDFKLREWAFRGGITPFDEECINPASIDLCVSTTLVTPLISGPVEKIGDTICIMPGSPFLFCTIEYIRMPNDCAGVVYLKSSLARQGLDHALAGFVDPGFCGQLTLELHAHCPIVLTHGQRVIQLVLNRLEDRPENVYAGKYQDQRGPTGAR
jgi:dCTP deaminase